ncbi:hypothetical protein M5K25_025548 [Dendrobium thyrsiflorum]|uniref:Uncharacterized protein n=1 Tax=Dendrobium thyrsiflorum TaxID=117978 RepID=A0ABD0U9I9_DENTH
MEAKKVDALEGEMEQFKSGVEEKFSTIEEIFSTMKNWIESRFGGPPTVLSHQHTSNDIRLEREQARSNDLDDPDALAQSISFLSRKVL